MLKPIDCFDGKYSFLSNFYNCFIQVENISYPTNEHAFQAMKTFDTRERLAISFIETPGKAKRYGRKVKLRDDWEDVKVDIMKGLVRIKFLDYALRKELIDTFPRELIEGNTWNDRFWGICNGIGENNLGKILMEIREECLLKNHKEK